MSRENRIAILVGIVAVAIRSIAIDQPFEDRWSWRQSDVAAIARNYFEGGFRFAYPQVDWAGEQTGYVGTEFPLLPFTAALIYNVAGVHEWIGRLESVAFFALSLPYFYLLVRKRFGLSAANWSLVFYSFAPVMMMASRCFMPDVPSLSLGIVALYYFDDWIATLRRSAFWISALSMALALLIKLPTAVIAAPMALLVFRQFQWRSLRRWDLYLWGAIALLPSLFWYWHAHRVAEAFYPFHFFGGGGVRLMPLDWYGKIGLKLLTATLTPILGVAALIGLWTSRRNGRAEIFYAWFFAMLVFIVVVGWGNRHEWYQLPLVPIAAAFAGAACSQLSGPLANAPARLVFTFSLVLLFGSFSALYARRLYEPSGSSLRTLGLELKKGTPRGSLIIAADDGDPTVFYYAERTGWHFPENRGLYYGNPADDEQLINDLERLRQRGATHLVFYGGTTWWLDYYHRFAEHLARTSTPMHSAATFRIFQLQPAQ